MEPLDTLNLWMERARDRARAISFGRFLWHRFLDDRLFGQRRRWPIPRCSRWCRWPSWCSACSRPSPFSTAGATSSATTSSPTSCPTPRAAEGYLRQFSASAGQLTAAGFIALVVSLLITLNSVEETFNQIWRVGSTRPKLTRFLVYWTVLTLGAMLAAASLAVSARVFALPLFGTQEGRWLAELALRLAPILIEFVCITLMFRVVPHHTVKWRHAIPGAILAAVIPELVKWGIGAYLGSFQSYQKLYGTVAFVPILLLWIYLCWVAVLLGASLSSSMAAFRYQPVELRLPQGYEFYGLLRLLGRFQHARAKGKGLADDEILRLEPMLTDSLLQDLICNLQDIDLLRRDERGEWLSRDLDQVSWPIFTNAPSCASRWPSSTCRIVMTAWDVPHWRRWTICDCPCVNA